MQNSSVPSHVSHCLSTRDSNVRSRRIGTSAMLAGHIVPACILLQALTLPRPGFAQQLRLIFDPYPPLGYVEIKKLSTSPSISSKFSWRAPAATEISSGIPGRGCFTSWSPALAKSGVTVRRRALEAMKNDGSDDSLLQKYGTLPPEGKATH